MRAVVLTLLFFPCVVYGQHAATAPAYGGGAVETFTNIAGQPFFPKRYEDVNGTPYLFDDWTVSNIVLNDGRVIKNIRTNFNLVTNELLYQDEKGQTMVAKSTVVKLVEAGTRKFITTPAKNTYYEVLSTEGKAMLLKYYKKVILETKPFNSATIQKNFVIDESHLLLVGDNVTEVKSAKDIYEALSPSDNLKDFAKKERLRQKSTESWVKIVDYYNSI